MTVPVFPEWAATDIAQTVLINAVEVIIDNKLEPTPEWKASGELFNENLPYPYINYQFDLINDWMVSLNSRAYGEIGDIYSTTDSPSVGDLAIRFGGTWTARGTQNLGTIVGANIFERTA